MGVVLSTPVWTDSAVVGNLWRILAVYAPQIYPLRMEKNVEVEGPASILSSHERTRFNNIMNLEWYSPKVYERSLCFFLL